MKNAQNNTLGLNSNVIKAILSIAATLQANYNDIGATGHQNVRNPFPMHKLIINVLPTSKSRALSFAEIQSAIEAEGYRVAKSATSNGYTAANYLTSAVTRLVKSGAVKRKGTARNFRYWFAL